MLLAIILANSFVPQLQEGDVVPEVVLSDQVHQPVEIGPQQRNVQVVSFFYARCPDVRICSTMSGKFSWMQQHLQSSDHISLIEITIDPAHDTTPIRKNYARLFGADAHIWHIAKAQPQATTDLLRRFVIIEQRTSTGSIVHSEAIAIIRPHGRIQSIIRGDNTNPQDILNIAREAEGQQTFWPQRLLFWLQQNAGTLCGRPNANVFLTTGTVLSLLAIACVFSAWALFRACTFL